MWAMSLTTRRARRCLEPIGLDSGVLPAHSGPRQRRPAGPGQLRRVPVCGHARKVIFWSSEECRGASWGETTAPLRRTADFTRHTRNLAILRQNQRRSEVFDERYVA